jgi:hypothetical protein
MKSKCALVISAGFDLINSPLQSDVVNLFPLLSSAVERPPSNLIINLTSPLFYLVEKPVGQTLLVKSV